MIIITGQTATGKTDLGLKLAKEYNGEIINADSRQIYQKLNIITGKELKKNQKFFLWKTINHFQIGFYIFDSIKIWLYDVIQPNQYFSSYYFTQLADLVVNEIKKQNKTPILVGGTYFYLKHFLCGFDYRVNPNWSLRKKLEKLTLGQLQKELLKINPNVRNEINSSDWQNPRRLIRKIEVFNKKGGKINSPPRNLKNEIDQFIGLKFSSKEKLIKTIKNRVRKRTEQGAIEEVKDLLKLGYHENNFGLKTIGYQQIIAYLKGKISREEAIEQWVTKEIQYAKRQLTFMKKDPHIKWKEI